MNYNWIPKLNTAKFLNDEPNALSENLLFDDNIPHIKVYLKRQIINENENKECEIMNKNIENNEQYLHCFTCNNNYIYTKKYKNTNCPFCRSTMLINNKLFIFKNKK